MGAWGVLAFDNDEACDWASDLEKAADLSLVEAAFAAVAGPAEYLDAHEACNALAACEVLARLLGSYGYRNPYTEAVDAWVASHQIQPTSDLLARADAVIDRVLGENQSCAIFGTKAKAWALSGTNPSTNCVTVCGEARER